MWANEIIEKICAGDFDKKISDLYMNNSVEEIKRQKNRYVCLIDDFIKMYDDREVKIISSPGRTEICGNHVDHQNGIVVAGAINVDIIAVVSENNSDYISINSNNTVLKKININCIDKNDIEEGTSEAIVSGVLYKLKSLGYKLGGFNACITSDIMIGSGLSSSAAFENLVGTIVSALFNNNNIDALTIAKASQFSEREYYGKPCGLMDQIASSSGGLVKIDFRDNENVEIENINFDLSKYKTSLCILDTRASHEGLTDEYTYITEEMNTVASYYGKSVLRDVNENIFYSDLNNLREKFGDRAVLRSIHFYDEIDRVNKCVDAIRNNNFIDFKRCINESGESSFKYLQNVYSCKNTNEQSMSLAICLTKKILKNHGVCRVHGGGFAGTILVFVDDDYVNTYKKEIEKIFGSRSCLVLKIRKYGAKMII